MSREAVSRMEALIAEFKTSMESLTDDMFLSQLRLGAGMLANAVGEANVALNAARINDIEFALADLIQIADGLTASDVQKVRRPLQLFQQELQALKQTNSLPPELIERVRDFQRKLRERRTAIERQTYRPQGSAPEPLPHDPRQLRSEAELLRNDLAATGFASPSLDQLITHPESVRLHHLSSTIDELDVMVRPV